MAGKSYKREWKLARVTSLVLFLLVIIPFVAIPETNLFNSDQTGILFLLAILIFLGFILFIVSLFYMLVLAVFIHFDKKRIAKMPEQENLEDGLKRHQRSLLITISLAIISIVFFPFARLLLPFLIISLIVTIVLYSRRK